MLFKMNKKIKNTEKKLFIITKNIRTEAFTRDSQVDKKINNLKKDIEDIQNVLKKQEDGGSLEALFDEFLKGLY